MRQHAEVLAFGYMPTAIAHLIPFEISNLIQRLSRLTLVANFWRWTFVPVVRMKMVIHVSLEVRVTMKPRASADEHATREPFRAVITIRRTSVRRHIIIAVRAIRSNSDVNGHLRPQFGRVHCHEEAGHGSQTKIFESVHCSPHLLKGRRTPYPLYR